MTFVVDAPLATSVEVGENWTPTDAAGPCWIRVSWVESPSVLSAAVTVTAPGVVELTMVADHVPVCASYVGVPTASFGSLELRVTLSVGLASGSLTVIVAVLWDTPSAGMLLGESCNTMFGGSANADAVRQQNAVATAAATTAKPRIKRTSYPLRGPRYAINGGARRKLSGP